MKPTAARSRFWVARAFRSPGTTRPTRKSPTGHADRSLKAVVDKFQLHASGWRSAAAPSSSIRALQPDRSRAVLRVGTETRPATCRWPAHRLQATIHMANKIALGQIECAIAGGVDTASDARSASTSGCASSCSRPIAARPPAAVKASPSSVPACWRRRSGGDRAAHQDVDGAALRDHGKSGASRARIRISSRLNRTTARARLRVGFYATDRAFADWSATTPARRHLAGEAGEPEAGLRQAERHADRGHSTPLTDGASAVLLGSEDWPRARLQGAGLPRLVRDRRGDFAGPKKEAADGAAYAVHACWRAGMKLQDFDFYEIHEAFAAQVLCTLKAGRQEVLSRQARPRRAAGLHRSRQAQRARRQSGCGHPFAATGGRILAAAAKILDENGGGRC